MPKTGSLDDQMFPDMPVKEKPKVKRGTQEDGTYITSDGTVLAAKKDRRIPYDEPEAKQVDGNVEIVESPDGSLSFSCSRMDSQQHARAGYPERKRLKLYYRVDETYAGRPRPYYSYDELEQIRKGEMKR
jgi:hypothetical protein